MQDTELQQKRYVSQLFFYISNDNLCLFFEGELLCAIH